MLSSLPHPSRELPAGCSGARGVPNSEPDPPGCAPKQARRQSPLPSAPQRSPPRPASPPSSGLTPRGASPSPVPAEPPAGHLSAPARDPGRTHPFLPPAEDARLPPSQTPRSRPPRLRPGTPLSPGPPDPRVPRHPHFPPDSRGLAVRPNFFPAAARPPQRRAFRAPSRNSRRPRGPAAPARPARTSCARDSLGSRASAVSPARRRRRSRRGGNRAAPAPALPSRAGPRARPPRAAHLLPRRRHRGEDVAVAAAARLASPRLSSPRPPGGSGAPDRSARRPLPPGSRISAP